MRIDKNLYKNILISFVLVFISKFFCSFSLLVWQKAFPRKKLMGRFLISTAQIDLRPSLT
jgi:hypothetical protein